MISADVKADVKQEIKELVAIFYNFLKGPSKLEIQCRKSVYFLFNFIWLFHPLWYCPLRKRWKFC